VSNKEKKAEEKQAVATETTAVVEAPPVTRWTLTAVFENGTRLSSIFDGSDKEAQKAAKDVGAKGLEHTSEDGTWTYYPAPKIAKVTLQAA
jgi:hypothetical protein